MSSDNTVDVLIGAKRKLEEAISFKNNEIAVLRKKLTALDTAIDVLRDSGGAIVVEGPAKAPLLQAKVAKRHPPYKWSLRDCQTELVRWALNDKRDWFTLKQAMEHLVKAGLLPKVFHRAEVTISKQVLHDGLLFQSEGRSSNIKFKAA